MLFAGVVPEEKTSTLYESLRRRKHSFAFVSRSLRYHCDRDLQHSERWKGQVRGRWLLITKTPQLSAHKRWLGRLLHARSSGVLRGRRRLQRGCAEQTMRGHAARWQIRSARQSVHSLLKASSAHLASPYTHSTLILQVVLRACLEAKRSFAEYSASTLSLVRCFVSSS